MNMNVNAPNHMCFQSLPLLGKGNNIKGVVQFVCMYMISAEQQIWFQILFSDSSSVRSLES